VRGPLAGPKKRPGAARRHAAWSPLPRRSAHRLRLGRGRCGGWSVADPRGVAGSAGGDEVAGGVVEGVVVDVVGGERSFASCSPGDGGAAPVAGVGAWAEAGVEG